jgi:hypothetical protein
LPLQRAICNASGVEEMEFGPIRNQLTLNQLFRVPGQEPANIRKPVQVAQDFAVKVRLVLECRDPAFGSDGRA